MAPWLRTLAAFEEASGLVSITYKEAHNYL